MNRDISQIEAIIQYCDNIGEAITMFGADEEDFLSNTQFQHSCAFSLLQVGEIVKRLSPDITSKHPTSNGATLQGLGIF